MTIATYEVYLMNVGTTPMGGQGIQFRGSQNGIVMLHHLNLCNLYFAVFCHPSAAGLDRNNFSIDNTHLP